MNRYEVLGLKTDATLDEIKKAYKKLVARTHPDVAGEVMKPLFLSVQDAYETLVDPSKRAAYDLEIGQTRQSPPRTERTTSTQPGPAPRQDKPAEPRHQQKTPPAAETRVAPPTERELRLRRLKIGAVVAFFTGLGGYWLFQEINLWALVQSSEGPRLLTFQGLPAIVYAILWAFGTLVASVADDLGTAAKTPLGCAAVSAGFAFITATGTTGIWMPALITGLVLTFSIAAAIRMREDLAYALR